jgi:hypothetical protein
MSAINNRQRELGVVKWVDIDTLPEAVYIFLLPLPLLV